jgi:hypothetical protein
MENFGHDPYNSADKDIGKDKPVDIDVTPEEVNRIHEALPPHNEYRDEDQREAA